MSCTLFGAIVSDLVECVGYWDLLAFQTMRGLEGGGAGFALFVILRVARSPSHPSVAFSLSNGVSMSNWLSEGRCLRVSRGGGGILTST